MATPKPFTGRTTISRGTHHHHGEDEDTDDEWDEEGGNDDSKALLHFDDEEDDDDYDSDDDDDDDDDYDSEEDEEDEYLRRPKETTVTTATPSLKLGKMKLSASPVADSETDDEAEDDDDDEGIPFDSEEEEEEIEDNAERGVLQGNSQISFRPRSGTNLSSLVHLDDEGSGTNSSTSSRGNSIGLEGALAQFVAADAATKANSEASKTPPVDAVPSSAAARLALKANRSGKSRSADECHKEAEGDESGRPRKGSDAGFLRLPKDLELQIRKASLGVKTVEVVVSEGPPLSPKKSAGSVMVEPKTTQQNLASAVAEAERIDEAKGTKDPTKLDLSFGLSPPTYRHPSPRTTATTAAVGESGDAPPSPTIDQSLNKDTPDGQPEPAVEAKKSRHMERRQAAREAKKRLGQKPVTRPVSPRNQTSASATATTTGEQSPILGGAPLSPMPKAPGDSPRKSTNNNSLGNSGDKANVKKFFDMVTESAVQTTTKLTKKGPTSAIENIQLGELIGKGAFGAVFRGLNTRTGRLVAVKRMPIYARPEASNSLMMEMGLLESFDHENIIKYIQFIPSQNHYNFVMEFAEGGSLSSLLKDFGSFSEPLISVYIGQVLKGLKYLHERSIIHRDIKAANILLTKDGVVKLADFGISLVIEVTLTRDENGHWGEGSPYWMAPEVIEGHKPTPACDIWSLGCTVYEVLSGSPPYGDMPPMSALFKMVHDGHPPFPDEISPALRDFLTRCFQMDPTQRPSSEDLLKHPFISGESLDDYLAKHETVGSAPQKQPSLPSVTGVKLSGSEGHSFSTGLVAMSRSRAISAEFDVEAVRNGVSAFRRGGSGFLETFSTENSPVRESSSHSPSYSPARSGSYINDNVLPSKQNVPIKGIKHKVITATSIPTVKVTSLSVVEGNIWVGCSDGSIVVYNEEGEFISRNSGSHTGSVNQMLVIDEVKQVWTCSNDCSVKVWGGHIGVFPKPKSGWLDLEFKTLTGTKRRKVFCCIDKATLSYHRLDSGKEKDCLGSILLTEDSVLAVDRSKKNRRYCFTLDPSPTTNKRLRFYAADVEEMTEWMRALYTAMRGNCLRHVHTLQTPDHLEINCLVDCNDTVWLGCMDMVVRVWDKATYERRKDISLEPFGLAMKKMERVVWRMLKLTFEKAVWVACGNNIIRIHSETYTPIDELFGHERLINALIETRGGPCRDRGVCEVWSAGSDQTIRIWNSRTGQCIKSWEAHHEKILSLLWTGDFVWSSSWGHTLRLWKTKSGDFDREVNSDHKGPVSCLALDDSKETLYSGSTDATLIVWK